MRYWKKRSWGFLVMALLAYLGVWSELGKAEDLPKLKTVKKVELKRYLGKWYEIATIPQYFQRRCGGGTTATYTLREDGDIEVLNECWTKDGELAQVKGRAWVVDADTNAKLRVSFIPWFKINFLAGEYWIIDLGPNYEYAVIGHPSRKYCWILSRTPELPEATLKGILNRLQEQGYDLSKLVMTNQKDFQK